MAQIINTNVLSLTAQRNLTSSQGALQTSLQRLSSGLRINSAKDDAAGLAISERFTTQIRGLNQAVRNANDGISLSQTAEGALAEMNNNLQRIRELAVQSANATNSSSDRTALDQEVQQRLAEINRIANQTSFNGQKILDGTFGDAKFQVGANVGETIDLSLNTSMRLDSIGAVATATSVNLGDVITEGTDDSAGTYTTGAITATDFSDATGTEGTAAFADTALNADLSGSPLVIEVDGTEVTLNGADLAANVAILDGLAGYSAAASGGTVTLTRDDGVGAPVLGGAGAGSLGTITSDDGTPGTVSFQVDGNAVTLDADYGSLAGLAAEIGDQLGTDYAVSVVDGGIQIATAAAGDGNAAPVLATFTGIGQNLFADGTSEAGADGDPAQSVTVAGDFSIQIGDGAAVAVADGEYTSAQGLVDAINLALGGEGNASLNDDGTMTITSQSTITVSGDVGLTDLGFAAENLASGDLTSVNVLTQDAANDAIYRMDSALTSVSDLRSTFGAIQNRFESTITNLSTTSENLEASRSRIRDADFAAETADLTRAQILQQAGISVLAQANAVPQSVLALLQ